MNKNQKALRKFSAKLNRQFAGSAVVAIGSRPNPVSGGIAPTYARTIAHTHRPKVRSGRGKVGGCKQK